MLVIDRLRQVFVVAGHPGLDQEVRPTAYPVPKVEEALAVALQQTAFNAVRRRHLLTLALSWHDQWAAAHDLCQTMEGDRDMDLVHAILHRREGDADNADYWFARVGQHPIFPRLLPVAAAEGLTDLVADGAWRPRAFVNRCLRATPDQRPGLMRIQAAELLALLDHLATHPVHKPRPAGYGR
jgi:hypothetical protein